MLDQVVAAAVSYPVVRRGCVHDRCRIGEVETKGLSEGGLVACQANHESSRAPRPPSSFSSGVTLYSKDRDCPRQLVKHDCAGKAEIPCVRGTVGVLRCEA